MQLVRPGVEVVREPALRGDRAKLDVLSVVVGHRREAFVEDDCVSATARNTGERGQPTEGNLRLQPEATEEQQFIDQGRARSFEIVERLIPRLFHHAPRRLLVRHKSETVMVE